MIRSFNYGRIPPGGAARICACLAGLAMLSLLLVAGVARAGNADDTMQVSVQVLASCILQGATLDFGEYIGQERSAATQILVKCQPKVPYNVALDQGQHYDGIYRGIARDGQRIAYALHQPNGHEWGDSDFANSYHWAASVFNVASGVWQAVTVNGTLFGGAIVGAGEYTDTVLITIYF